MTRLPPAHHLRHEGDRQISERTDSEYYDKKLARLAAEFDSLPWKWKKTYLEGLDPADLKELRAREMIG